MLPGWWAEEVQRVFQELGYRFQDGWVVRRMEGLSLSEDGSL